MSIGTSAMTIIRILLDTKRRPSIIVNLGLSLAGEMKLIFGAVSYKTGTLRSLSFLLAVFIFTVTALVNLTHSKADFQSIACEPASCAPSDGLEGGAAQPCLACMIVKAFQTAQVILFFFLLTIATLVSGSCLTSRNFTQLSSFPTNGFAARLSSPGISGFPSVNRSFSRLSQFLS